MAIADHARANFNLPLCAAADGNATGTHIGGSAS
jgi:hypothetical protein